MSSDEISLTEKAITELKTELAKDTLLYEERINMYFSESELNFLLLLVLRGEGAASIPIKLKRNDSEENKYKEIKNQIKQFINSYNHKLPVYFTINDCLDKNEEIQKWFYGFEAKLICNDCSRIVQLNNHHIKEFAKKMKCDLENFDRTKLKVYVENKKVFCKECKSKNCQLEINSIV